MYHPLAEGKNKMRGNPRQAALFGILSLVIVTGCGGGANQTNQPQPPTTANAFSKASLNGTYVFTANGADIVGPFALLGTMQADGNGGVTTGRTFIQANSGSTGNFALTGSYTVQSDGHAVVNLLSDAIGPVTLDLILLSPDHGLVMRFDSVSTASGTLDKQDPSAFDPAIHPVVLCCSWIFNFRGTDTAGRPEAAVGSFTIETGNSITGTVDENDANLATFNAPILPGPVGNFFEVGPEGGGAFAYTTSAGTLHQLHFIAIDANHLKLISDTSVEAGDLYSPAVLLGSFAFTVSGPEGYAAGGVLNLDGAGNVLDSSVEDTNVAGSISLNAGASGTYSITPNGRIELLLNDRRFSIFAGYPSTGGIQLVQMNGGVASGVGFLELGATRSNASLNGRYGANISGSTGGGKFGEIAQLTADGNGNLTGSGSINNAGTLTSGLKLDGTYLVSPNGRAVGTLATSTGTMNVVFYVSSGNQVSFIGVDTDRVSQGVLVQQQ
jgi:hypothetical protein